MARPLTVHGAKDEKLQVRLDAKLLQELREAAERRGVSMSKFVRTALVRELDRRPAEEGALGRAEDSLTGAKASMAAMRERLEEVERELSRCEVALFPEYLAA